MRTLDRAALVNLVQRIINADGTEEELAEMIEMLKSQITDPNISDYIFWNQPALSAEEIIAKALEYKPIPL